MAFRAWVLQDWTANAGQPETQVLLAWFRLAQWAGGHWGSAGRLVTTPYWLITSLLLGFELPPTASIGPRLRVTHRNGIVVSHHATLGSDCQLRHGVTIGNKTDRTGREVGVARIEVAYGEPLIRTYRDLWVVSLHPDGRCTAFEEWPFFPDRPRAAVWRSPRG